ncbi:unnamed protein product [Calypogeia fissa]
MSSRLAVMVLLFAGLLLQHGAAPVNAANWYEVGGDNGWTFPPNGIATFFDDWANQYTFHVGDTLFFRYEYHSVLEVVKADLTSCTTTNPINSYLSAANTSVTLDRTGYYGFICGLPSHCVANMKLELTVLAPGQVAAPGSAPTSSGPSASSSTALGPATAGPAEGPVAHQNGASSVQSFPAMVSGALLAVSAFLFL